MTLFAKTNSVGVVTQYPISEQEVRAAFPRVSLPAVMRGAPSGFVIVQEVPRPEYDPLTQEVVEGPVLKQGSTYKQVWNVVALSDEIIAKNKLAQAKIDRIGQVNRLKVTTAAGHEFDGDDESRTNMAQAIAALNDGETTTWILANNVPTQVSKEELREALRLAGAKKTEFWVAPYI